MTKQKNYVLQPNIVKKSIDFMRSWFRVNWDLVLKTGEPQIMHPEAWQINVEFEVENIGRNILFDAFMKIVKVRFRLTKNEYGTFIWSVEIDFNFKDDGHNGWTYSRNFVLEHGNFIEKAR